MKSSAQYAVPLASMLPMATAINTGPGGTTVVLLVFCMLCSMLQAPFMHNSSYRNRQG